MSVAAVGCEAVIARGRWRERRASLEGSLVSVAERRILRRRGGGRGEGLPGREGGEGSGA